MVAIWVSMARENKNLQFCNLHQLSICNPQIRIKHCFENHMLTLFCMASGNCYKSWGGHEMPPLRKVLISQKVQDLSSLNFYTHFLLMLTLFLVSLRSFEALHGYLGALKDDMSGARSQVNKIKGFV